MIDTRLCYRAIKHMKICALIFELHLPQNVWRTNRQTFSKNSKNYAQEIPKRVNLPKFENFCESFPIYVKESNNLEFSSYF